MAGFPLITDAGPEIVQAIKVGFTALTVAVTTVGLAVAYAVARSHSLVGSRARNFASREEIGQFLASCDASTLELDAAPVRSGQRPSQDTGGAAR